MYKAIDLFAGIGGIRLGFEQAFGDDLETVFASELDRFAVQTYEANFHDPFGVTGDITKVDSSDVPDHDILLAGFPCQSFSISGVSKLRSLGRPTHEYSPRRTVASGALFVCLLQARRRPRIVNGKRTSYPRCLTCSYLI